jgi:nucleotide-binding universal stress UspA family protein
MYSKILAAVENSETSERVFRQALELAQATQAQLMLVHGLSGEEEGSPLPLPPTADRTYWIPGADADINFDLWREQWEHYETEGLERLRRFAAIANEQNVSTEFRQITGHPGKVICQFAQQWQADLIVVGHRGRSGLSELMLGSISNYVLHRAHCSVLVLRDRKLTETTVKDRTATPQKLAS